MRFFGKAIADQRPFSDDRGWQIELDGVKFTVNLLISGAVGVGAALGVAAAPDGFWNHFLDFFVIGVIGQILIITSAIMGEELYDIKLPVIQRLRQKIAVASDGWQKDMFKNSNPAYISLWAPVVIFFLVALEYRSGDTMWLIIVCAQAFLTVIACALHHSLLELKPQYVDVYFTDGRKPLKQHRLLKITDNTVRLRHKDKVILLNRSQVRSIDMPLQAEFLRPTIKSQAVQEPG